MKFNSLIKTHLFPILKEYGFEIANEFKNIIQFQSSFMKVSIVYNKYENSNFVEIGERKGPLYPLNDYVIKSFFNSSLLIEQVTTETFVQNLSILFKTKEGVQLLKGEGKSLKHVIEEQSESFTSKLISKQVLEVASKAWRANNYKGFIESIDEIGINNIPKSYQLKYKLAKKKLF